MGRVVMMKWWKIKVIKEKNISTRDFERSEI